LSGLFSVVVPVLESRGRIHQFHRGLMPLRHGHFVLDADVAQCLDVELRRGDPTETLTKGVVGIHHIPMAGSVGHGNGALGPVVVPLRHLNKRKCREKETKQTGEHAAFTCLNILGGIWVFLRRLVDRASIGHSDSLLQDGSFEGVPGSIA
jgi:hypothetical protein